MIRNLILALLFLSATTLFAQEDSTEVSDAVFTLSGFADAYYSYDFGLPEPGGVRQGFLFNHNRHNEFNVNLALVKLSVDHERYRANVAIQTGTYAVDNYAAEQAAMRSINEANVGIALNAQRNLWLDAGIFGSHLGFESAISSDNPTLTRSLVAENSPYFLSGAKLTYDPNENWTFVGVLTNGWQRIRRVQDNSMMSVGTQVQYKPKDGILINWSTFYGTEDPDNARRNRFFNNFYLVYGVSEALTLTGGVDFGRQQETMGSSTWETWAGITGILHYRLSEEWAVAGRFEYFTDDNGVIFDTGTPNGFTLNGFSANIDYSPFPDIMARLEARIFSAEDEIFQQEGNPVNTNMFFTTSIAVRIHD